MSSSILCHGAMMAKRNLMPAAGLGTSLDLESTLGKESELSVRNTKIASSCGGSDMGKCQIKTLRHSMVVPM